MMILSARFAVLACLCAALPFTLPPPVEAAHIYAGHSMGKHASSSHFQQRTRDASFFGGPTAAHRHDGKNNDRQEPHHRASGLPPLLRRYRAHDHNEVYNHQGQDPHDHANHKVPRSAFARSRYRREPGSHSPRSSVYVSGEHGNTYVVSRTSSRNWAHGGTGTDKRSSHDYNRRQADESNLVMGRIDIMASSFPCLAAAQSLGSAQRLASLTVDSTPIDWTSGQNSAKAFPLNASTTNQTQFFMMSMDEPSNAAGSSIKHVTLATEVFDASNAEMIMYCATYDADPGATSALLMTPCAGTTQSVAPADDAADPCADDGNDASSSNPHESQTFSYDPSTGQIEPMSAVSSSSGTGNSSDGLAPCAGARVRRDTGNLTTSGSARPSSTSTSTAPTTSASQQVRNVTLVYVAGAPEVPAPSPSSSSTTATPSASIGPAAVLTTTITTTVVAAVTASAPSNRTVTPAQAAVSVSTSSIPSQSTTIATPSGFTTSTTARPSLSPLSSVSATATSRAPVNADESFEVEIVGVTPSTTATASSSSMSTMTMTTTTTTTYSSAGTSLNAQAVASSIANAMVSRRAVIVSASVA
ncbi:hypothetical protein J3R83DRAFT_8573 [Lanmaoa asiatica]|nr:hypothetical protein J3R83DRAFT_8573 [Lanmaoa asiatica]